jgi:hypothetical protein
MLVFLPGVGPPSLCLAAPSEGYLQSFLGWLQFPLLIPNNQGTCPSSPQKHTFLYLFQASLPEIGKCLLQISNVIFLLRAFHYDIINIGQYIPAYLRMKDLSYHPAEASSDIFEPLKHPKIAIGATGSYEASLRLIFLHPYLMIA